MAIIRITTPSIADDAIDNTKLDLGDDYTFTGTVEGAGGGIFESQLFHVRDEKSTDTDGGSYTADTDNTRDLNTVLTNEITGASLSSNQITLPSGTYYIQASAPAFNVNRHRILLQNTTDSSLVLLGTSEFIAPGRDITTRAFLFGRFTISAQKVFEIRHYIKNTGGNLGVDTIDGRNEVYTDVKIWKVA
jgi:hypothetical protein